MKYNERYDLVMFRDGIWIYDTERDTYANPDKPIEFVTEAKNLIESYEDNLAEAAFERSQRD